MSRKSDLSSPQVPRELRCLEKEDLALLLEELSTLPDPRREGSIIYPIKDLVFIALCCMISGQIAFTDMARFAELRHSCLSRLLGYEAPRPSHDAFRSLFMMLDEEELSARLTQWTHALRNPQQEHPHVALDGKSKACGLGSGGGKPLLHTVSAFLCQQGLTLCERVTADKGGEVQALRETIAALDLKDAVVTIDAGGCFTEMAAALHAKGASYVLSLKGNQPSLLQQVECFFAQYDQRHPAAHAVDPTGGHGRREERTLHLIDDLGWLEGASDWPGVRAVIRVRRHRRLGSARSSGETAYYLSSWPEDECAPVEVIRGHWAIENQ